MAKLLGERAIRDLRSYVGLRGDYTPERLFGSAGRNQAADVRAHNREITNTLKAQIGEWTGDP